MPESQFGTAPDTLEAALGELVALARHLRATPADISRSLGRLEGLAQMLRYFTLPTGSYVSPDQPMLGPATACAFDGCLRTAHDLDACLLNFAPRGEVALWLCRDHHPPPGEGGIRPPGWTPPLSERDRTDAARTAALALLDREQLRLVNPRMQGA